MPLVCCPCPIQSPICAFVAAISIASTEEAANRRLYVTGFVAPASGETVWYLSNGIDKPFFAKLLAAFARQTGAGRDRIIVLQLDNAGWHGPENLPVPDGIRLVYQPPRSPEFQPAERLWPLVDEPLVN